MKKIVAGLLCFMSLACAIEIDVPFVKSQADANKDDIGARLMLIKYYLQNHNYDEAESYVNQILEIDKHQASANKIKKRLSLIRILEEKSTLKNASVDESLQKLLEQKKYTLFCEYYEQAKVTGVSFDSKMDLDAADAYFKIGELEKSSALLDKHNYTKSVKVDRLKKKIALKKAENDVSSSKKPEALNDYIYLLNKNKNPKKVIRELRKYVKQHPKNADARISLAENLYWKGKVKKAFHALYTVRKYSDKSKKLYANILYDMADYEHALYYLPEVSAKEKSKKERYKLEKRTAFAYRHVGEKEKAERLFKKLLKQNPRDKEIVSYHDSLLKKELLEVAIAHHKQKEYANALKFYRAYHDKTHDPKIAKEIAEIYYFNQEEKLSLPYFKAYLSHFPDDTLIRYHYASAYEKDKNYAKSIPEFRKILQVPSALEYNLARYHYSHNLMKTYQDSDWYKARKELKSLVAELDADANPKEVNLLKFSRALLKTAVGPVRKPTRYKDIVLTEGSYKVLTTVQVFSVEDIRFIEKPSAKSLLHKDKNDKLSAWMGLEYVDDSAVTYTNYKIGVDNLLVANGVKYGMEIQNFAFDSRLKEYDGMGLFLKAQIDKFGFGLGLEHFDDLDVISPSLTWNPSDGAHNIFMEASYKNGAFVNYRNCMIQNETNVYHLGIYDSILMDNLQIMILGLDVNHFEDDNNNLFGQFTLPLYTTTTLGLEHSILFNENLEYNSNTKVCTHPTEFYDTSYMKYKPKYRFKHGTLEASVGAGYSFNNEEVVYAYGLSGDYTIEKFATFTLNCEQLQSSFTAEAMTFCRFNMMQNW